MPGESECGEDTDIPELPEVETIARGLHESIRGAVVSGVHVRRSDVLRLATPRKLRERLIGHRIDRCWRRAKTALIDFSSGDRVGVQPRFTGALLVDSSDTPLPHDEAHYSTLHLELVDGRRLHYVDVRRLGTFTLMNPEQFARFDSRLGIEPLAKDFTPSVFSALLRGSSQAVKKFIMDQTKVVGVGNIYANEALWRAGIDPSKAARAVSEPNARLLHREIVAVLSEAIEARGTSFRDYRDASGEPGEFFNNLNAYGKAGTQCKRCGHSLIGTHAIDGRATVFCAYCQR